MVEEKFEEEEEKKERAHSTTLSDEYSRILIPQSYVDGDGMFYFIYRAGYFCKKVEKGAKSRGCLRSFFFC